VNHRGVTLRDATRRQCHWEWELYVLVGGLSGVTTVRAMS